MKKLVLLSIVAAGMVFIGCEDTKKTSTKFETVVEETKDVAVKASDATVDTAKEAAEATKDTIDTIAQKTSEAAEETKENIQDATETAKTE